MDNLDALKKKIRILMRHNKKITAYYEIAKCAKLKKLAKVWRGLSWIEQNDHKAFNSSFNYFVFSRYKDMMAIIKDWYDEKTMNEISHCFRYY